VSSKQPLLKEATMTQRTYTRRTPAQWQQHITDQQHSGLSIAGYCRQNHLATSNFYTWLSKLRPNHHHQATSSKQVKNDWLAIPRDFTASSSPSEGNTLITLTLPGNIILTLRSV
jgi:hypothetical protein